MAWLASMSGLAVPQGMGPTVQRPRPAPSPPLLQRSELDRSSRSTSMATARPTAVDTQLEPLGDASPAPPPQPSPSRRGDALDAMALGSVAGAEARSAARLDPPVLFRLSRRSSHTLSLSALPWRLRLVLGLQALTRLAATRA